MGGQMAEEAYPLVGVSPIPASAALPTEATQSNAAGQDSGFEAEAGMDEAVIPRLTERTRPAIPALRKNAEAIRHTFETGEYPYRARLSNQLYLKQMAHLQVELLKAQNWAKETGQKIIVLF